MIDKNNYPLRLEGKYCILEEISPKYFQYVIEWRNNPELNKYLNQPFKLTMELEKQWYENIYMKDDTQCLWIVIDKATNTPIGTTGHTDLDCEKKRCIGGRLLLGRTDYSNQPAFLESFFVGSDYMYRIIDIQYCHVVKKNRRALKINRMLGFEPNIGEIQYPSELFVHGMEQIELFRTKEMYLKVRDKIFNHLGNALFN